MRTISLKQINAFKESLIAEEKAQATINKYTKDVMYFNKWLLDKKLDKFWAKNSGAEKFISKTADFEEIKRQTLEVLESSQLTDADKKNIKNN